MNKKEKHAKKKQRKKHGKLISVRHR